MKRALLLIALLATSSAALAGPKMTKEFVGSGGQTRAYYLFIPDRPLGAAPAPLLITLHGSGHNGASLVEYWQGLAEQKGFVVAGPDSSNPQQWKYPEDGPDFLRDVIDAVKAKTAIDPRRVYLFGHSAGAYFGLQISLLESEYFAATAHHACGVSEARISGPAAGNAPPYARLLPLRARDQRAGVGVPLEGCAGEGPEVRGVREVALYRRQLGGGCAGNLPARNWRGLVARAPAGW